MTRQNFSRRTFLGMGAATAATMLLTGCHFGKPLNVAGNAGSPGHALLFMSEALGLLDPGKVQLLAQNPETPCAFLGQGQVPHAAVIPLEECLKIFCQGVDLEIVLVVNASIGADAVMVPVDGRFTDGRPGKRIAYEDTALARLMVAHFLRFYGVDPASIERVPLAPGQHMQVWESERPDALVTYEPYITQLTRNFSARQFFTSRHLPDMMFDVLAVRPDALRRQKSGIRHLLDAYFQALAHFYANPMDASHRIASRLGIEARDILQVFRRYHLPDARTNYNYLSRKESGLRDIIESQYLTLQELDIPLREPAQLNRLLNPDFLPRNLL